MSNEDGMRLGELEGIVGEETVIRRERRRGAAFRGLFDVCRPRVCRMELSTAAAPRPVALAE